MKVDIEIRRCRGRDIRSLRGKLRAEDVLEISRRSGRDPYAVLVYSYRHSDEVYVGLVNSEIACVWGVAQESLLAENASIWLLSTPVMERAPVAIARRTRSELHKLLRRYRSLGNYVDSQYVRCVRWLRWLGFTLEAPEPVGVRGELFSRFYIKSAEYREVDNV